MKLFGKGCLVIVGVFILLGVIGAIIGGGNKQQTAAPAAAAISGVAEPSASSTTVDAVSAPAPTEAPQLTSGPEAFTVGQDVQVDEVRWKILEATDLGQTLKSDNQFIEDKTTSGHFVQVRFEIENLSKDLLSFAGMDLLDAEERSFKPSTDVIGFIDEDQYCLLENLNPNVAKTCTAIYEVPANATDLQAKVGDLKLFGSQSALVKLGL